MLLIYLLILRIINIYYFDYVSKLKNKIIYICTVTVIIKTCAYNDRFALKCAFGKSYNTCTPVQFIPPPSYDVRFSSTATSS